MAFRYDETSLNTKCGMEGLSSFKNVLGYDLEYWDPFSLQVAQMKHIFVQLGFTPCKTKQSLQDMELQEEEAQKD